MCTFCASVHPVMTFVFQRDNTALHYAAASGLQRCVELLVNHNAPLFTENVEKETPCDTAEKNGHHDIANYLESKMVFSVRVYIFSLMLFIDVELLTLALVLNIRRKTNELICAIARVVK